MTQANDTSIARTYSQLPESVPGYDQTHNLIIPQKVVVSSTYPGIQIVMVSGDVDRISIPSLAGQLIIVDARASSKIVVVQEAPADVAAPLGANVVLVPAGGYVELLSSSAGWFLPKSPNVSYDVANILNYSTIPLGQGQDATAAFDAAYASGASTIYFPSGTYVLQPRTLTRLPVWIVGDGYGRSIIRVDGTADHIFQYVGTDVNPVNGGGIDDVTLRFSTPAAGSSAVRLLNINGFYEYNVEWDNCIGGITIGDGLSASNNSYGVYLIKILGNTMFASTSTCPILILGGGGTYITQCSFAQGTVPLPQPTQDITTPSGSCGLKVAGLGYTTIVVTDTIFYKFDRGVFLDCQTGTAIVDVWLNSALCDYCGSAGLDINSHVNANIANVHVVNGWYVGWNDVSINIRGAGFKQVCEFANSRAWFSGKEAIHVGATGTILGLTMTGMQAFFSNRQGGGQATVVIESGVSNWSFTGCNINIDLGAASPPGFNWTSPNGFNVGADCDACTIVGNVVYPIGAEFAGNGLYNNAAGNKRRIIKDNAGANYAGTRTWLEVSGSAAPVSTTTYTNRTPFTIEIYIAGVLTGLAKNGVDLGTFGTGDGKFLTLSPGDTVTPVFGGAMAFHVFAQP